VVFIPESNFNQPLSISLSGCKDMAKKEILALMNHFENINVHLHYQHNALRFIIIPVSELEKERC